MLPNSTWNWDQSLCLSLKSKAFPPELEFNLLELRSRNLASLQEVTIISTLTVISSTDYIGSNSCTATICVFIALPSSVSALSSCLPSPHSFLNKCFLAFVALIFEISLIVALLRSCNFD